MEDKNREISIEELEKVTGGNYEGPIAYDEIDEKAELLEWILETYGMENAVCACGGFYYDLTAKEIFRTQGAKAWAEYVKKNYNPRAGLDIVEEG
ncbi:MAG: hypothetical protein IKG01_09790 [Lachnospiraceae bacterium]|nr:hypothetical protein [Lachnospiraceae bacterium]